MSADNGLHKLRERIRRIDERILNLVAERITLARKIGEIKLEKGLPIRNFQVEFEVLQRALKLSKSLNLSPEITTELVKLLIQESISVQMHYKNQLNVPNSKNLNYQLTTLVVGGAGKMGSWFVNFLRSSGHLVEIVDPLEQRQTKGHYQSLPEALDKYDVIIVSTPLRFIASVLNDILLRKPRGVIVDIASLKSPVIKLLKSAKKEGLLVSSLHPMFGPTVRMLSGRNVIIASVGCSDADKLVESLFKETAVNLVKIDIEDHDKYMAYSLGLAHAINLLFGMVLKNSGISFPRMAEFAGTTFMKQVDTSREVFSEDSYLYHAIQFLNPHREFLFSQLQKSLEQLYQVSSQSSDENFVKMMSDGRTYYFGGEND